MATAAELKQLYDEYQSLTAASRAAGNADSTIYSKLQTLLATIEATATGDSFRDVQLRDALPDLKLYLQLNERNIAAAATNTNSTATTQPDAPDAPQVTESLPKNEEAVLTRNSKKVNEAVTPASANAVNLFAKPNSDDGKPSNKTASGVTTNTGSNTQAVQPTEIPKPTPNPLHDYATSTYGLTLYILSSEDFNHLQQADANKLAAWKPTHALISSGGGHQADRHPSFKDDFYFDNFKMSTIIGLNSMTRGTNAIQLSFSVVEPYGLTLLDRIVDAAKSVGSDNYLAQPYLLELDFHGAKDLGDISSPIQNLRKRFPIQIIEMKIKATVRGSEYQIQCIPYCHTAFSEHAGSTPANFEVTASTVSEFFNNTATNLSEQIAEKAKAKDDAARAAKPKLFTEGSFDPNTGEFVMGRTTTTPPDQKAVDAAQKIVSSPYRVDSYTGAVNAWNQTVIDKTHYKVPNEIEFVIDEEIANSPIVIASKTTPTRSSFSSEGVTDKKASAQGNDPTISDKTPTTDYDKTKMNWNVNAGTSVVDVINMVMRNSQYIQRQVIDPTAGELAFAEDKTVKYFKIIPQIILKDFDSLRNSYATKTVYHIKTYEYFNSKHPNLPYGTPKGPVKEYNYLYTGKNIDILDFSIDFDTAFYTSKVVDRDNKESTDAAPGADVENKPDKGRVPTGAGTPFPNQSKGISSEAQLSTTGADTAKAALVANAMGSIYSGSRGDMLNIKIKILGDPHFIKQDDLYTNPGMKNYNDKPVMLNSGTVSMDSKEIFCRINFKTPVDMDDKTGLPRPDGKYVISSFSGFYKIIKVDSEFSRGQFIQTLDAVRIFDKSISAAAVNEQRREQQDAEYASETEATDSRQISLAGATTVTPPTPQNPKSILDKAKSSAEEFVSTTKAKVNEVIDEAKTTAKSIQDKLAKDIDKLKPVDIGTQQAQDASSPEPQNPVEYPEP